MSARSAANFQTFQLEIALKVRRVVAISLCFTFHGAFRFHSCTFTTFPFTSTVFVGFHLIWNSFYLERFVLCTYTYTIRSPLNRHSLSWHFSVSPAAISCSLLSVIAKSCNLLSFNHAVSIFQIAKPCFQVSDSRRGSSCSFFFLRVTKIAQQRVCNRPSPPEILVI